MRSTVAELYDPFSFEIIRQLEAFGFCPPRRRGPFVEDGNIAPCAQLPGHHGWRDHVVQPSWDQCAAVAAGDPRRAAAARRERERTRSPERRWPCARTGVRAPCSATCCSWAGSDHEPPAPPAGGASRPHVRASAVRPIGRGVADIVCSTSSAPSAAITASVPSPCAPSAMRRHPSGSPVRDAAPSTAGRWSGARPTRRSVCRTPPPWCAWTKESG